MKSDAPIFYVMRDAHATFRVDIAKLFGKYLPRRGFSVTLVARPHPYTESWAGGEHLAFRRFPGALVRTMLRNPERIGAVQVRDQPVTAFIFAVLGRLTGVRCFYWMSFPFPDDDIAKYEYLRDDTHYVKRLAYLLRGQVSAALLYRIVLRLCDHVFVQSDTMASWLAAEKGCPTSKMTAVPMGVDMEEIAGIATTVSERYSSKSEARRVIAYLGVIGRLRIEDTLLDALEQVLKRNPEAEVWFIGGGQTPADEQILSSRLTERGLGGRYQITGWIPSKEAMVLASHADVALSILRSHPVLHMSSPTKTVEYAALGVPCVVSDVPDQKQLVEALRSGLSVGYDSAEIANALQRLLDSDELREEFSRNGREGVASVRGYDVIADKLADVYRRLLCRERNV